MQRPRYFDQLDALRFIAFLFIFLGHALDTPSAAVADTWTYAYIKTHIYTLGKTGFSFAFVLSSYINTWVMLCEREAAHGRFSPWRFYVRRALRIWPLYFVTLFIGFQVAPYVVSLLGESYQETAEPWWFVCFLGNFYLIEHGFTHSPILSVLWSVSVEEQFYIVWPFLLVLFGWSMRWLLPVMLAVFATTAFVFHGSDVNLFFHTLFLLSDIGIGAAFAFLSFHQGAWFSRLASMPKWGIACVYTVFGLSLVFYQPLFNGHIVPEPYSMIIEKIWFATLLGFIILEQNFSRSSIFKFGRSKVLTYLGTISYGLFCFHEIGLLVAQRIVNHSDHADHILWAIGLKSLLAFALITPMAHISWKWFEQPFLSLKRYFYTR